MNYDVWSKFPDTKEYIYFLHACESTCMGLSEMWGELCVCAWNEGYSNNFQSRLKVRVQPGSRSDQCFKLTCVHPTSEFALIRKRGTLMVAELKWITSNCGRRTGKDIETDTNKQSSLIERVVKFWNIFSTLKSLYCLSLAQNSNLNQLKAYKSFLTASGKQCMHTVGQHTTPTEKWEYNRDTWKPCKARNSWFLRRGSFSQLSAEH